MVLALLACVLAGAKVDATYDLAFVGRFYFPEKSRISHAYLYLSDLNGGHRRQVCRVGSMWDKPFWVGRRRVAWLREERLGVGVWVADAPAWKPRRLLVADPSGLGAEMSVDENCQDSAVWVRIGESNFFLTGRSINRRKRPDSHSLPNFGTGFHRIESAEIAGGKSGWYVKVHEGKTVKSFPIVNAAKPYAVTYHLEGQLGFRIGEDHGGIYADGHYRLRGAKRSWLVASTALSTTCGLGFLFTIDWSRHQAKNWLLNVDELSVRPERGLFAGRSERCLTSADYGALWTNEVIVGNLKTGKVSTVLSGNVFVGGASLRP
jgi:hypothetical protein